MGKIQRAIAYGYSPLNGKKRYLDQQTSKSRKWILSCLSLISLEQLEKFFGGGGQGGPFFVNDLDLPIQGIASQRQGFYQACLDFYFYRLGGQDGHSQIVDHGLFDALLIADE